MAVIKITFPKIGTYTSTWVHDDDWHALPPQEQNNLIYRFVKNHHSKFLAISQQKTGDAYCKEQPDFRWSLL